MMHLFSIPGKSTSRYSIACIICLYIISCTPALAQKAALLEDQYHRLDSLHTKEDYKTALKMESDVLASIHAREDTLAAATYFLLGDSYLQTGDHSHAIQYFEQEVALRRKIGQAESEDVSNSLYNLTYLYKEEGNYAQAKKTGTELLRIDKKIRGRASEEYLSSVQFVLDVLTQSGDYIKARELGEITLKDLKEDNGLYPIMLSKVADIYSAMGSYAKAEGAFRHAMALLNEREGAGSANLINATNNLALLYKAEGRYPEAEELLLNVCELLKKKADNTSQQTFYTALNNLGLVEDVLSQYEDAETSLKEVQAFDKNEYGETHPYYASTLSNLATIYMDMGKYSEAETLLNTALTILSNKEESKFQYATQLNNLANVYRLQGLGAKTIPLYVQAKQIFKEKSGEGSPEYATAAFNLGQAYFLNDDAKAKAELDQALALRLKLYGKEHPRYGEVTRIIARYNWAHKSYAEAESNFSSTFQNYFKQIDHFFPALSEEEKSKFYFGKLKPTFEEFNSYVVSRYHENPALLGDMYNYQLNTKALVMYATKRVRDNILQSKDTILIRTFGQWLEQKEQLSKLYSQNPDDSPKGLAKIDSLNKAVNALEKDLTKKSSLFNKTYKSKVITWKDVQKKLKPGEAAVEVIRFRAYIPEHAGSFTGNIAYAFLIVTPTTKNNPELILVNNGSQMEERYLNFYRNAIHHNLDDAISYKIYWEFLSASLKGYKKVYFSPDGVYNQINLNTLKNPATDKYIMDESFIQAVTNTKDLAAIQAPSTGNGWAYLIGFPTYNNATPAADPANANTIATTAPVQVQRGMRAGLLRYLRGDDGIPPLPGTKTEVAEIGKIFDAASVKTYTETNASEEGIKSLDNPKSIHIATHGFFLEDVDLSAGNATQKYIENPLLRSGLVLAGAGDFLKDSQKTMTEDGILTAYEVMNLNLDNTELVVLSACETGLGTVKNGEGVYGLQRAFQVAGAKAIVMSLWSVDDEATKDLMIAFYKEWNQSHNKQEAFHKAQVAVKEKYIFPFYWGAFVLIGN